MALKTINTLFYIDENKNGLKIHKFGTNPIRCFECPRNLIQIFKNEKYAENSGVYFLLNYESAKKFIYIGQAKNLYDRLSQHNNDETKD
jgi:hypothetical protein